MAVMVLALLAFFFSPVVAQLPTCSDGNPPFDFGSTTCTSAGATSSSCSAPNQCAALSDGSFGCCAPTTSTVKLPCADGMASTTCASWKSNGFCTPGVYTAATIRAYCASTCSMCTCTDAAAACSIWIQNSNFCHNPAYTLATIKTNCAASCGLC